MKFTLSKEILENEVVFYQENEAFRGVNKIADKVRKDLGLVFDAVPTTVDSKEKLTKFAVIYGTIGRSSILTELNDEKVIDLSLVEHKNEVYLFQVVQHPMDHVEQALVIAGSDKRGTIYGLFHLSELIGVSPYVDWCDVKPMKKKTFSLEEDLKYISKEPSVRFRGFFINDEWPAFGNWCNKNFGGFNAKAYEHVFELLLRLKGNYLWPAMWSARFEDDGPGLGNAELADEYGVVMGMSHHEPCLRQGEEYRYLRGKDSIYGDAWNFRTNEAGITKFWEDGLKRSGKFENVITVGMRGEADTAIMGKNATMADNIELLRDVLKTQRRLIKENVNEDLTKVPRMIALYKEVEAFFYGNEETKGLIGSEELEDVILMLCDDNYGNLRTLPTEEMRKHKGGYGMYYHFDYHGWPISFEWINSSYLPKVWEQITMAYDFGIRDLWIVNVGDICTQEFPLAYFLDLAYDFDAWGTKAINRTKEYTKKWIKQQFNGVFDEADQEVVFDILEGYTKMANRRRPEAMNEDIYHPVNEREAEKILAEIDEIMKKATMLYHKVAKEHLPAYVSLVYYPAMGTLNVYKMQTLTGINHAMAKWGIMEANNYRAKILDCMKFDKALVNEYHTIDDGKWFGMGLSEHIGFWHWNEDECRNPIIMETIPADKARILLSVDGTSQHAEGSPWLPNKLTVVDFLDPTVSESSMTLYSITDLESTYSITNELDWLQISSEGGSLDDSKRFEKVKLTIDRSQIPTEGTTGEIFVTLPAGKVTVQIPVENKLYEELPKNTFVDTKGYIAIEAEHYSKNHADEESGAAFQIIEGYGKTLSGVKVFPTTAYFEPSEKTPYLEYQFYVKEAGDYQVEVYMQPSNACSIKNELIYGVQCNEDAIERINTIPSGEKVGDNNRFWGEGVLNQIRRVVSNITCVEGLNTLRIYAVTPAFVLEKLVIAPKGRKVAESYLGPTETYYRK